MIKSILIFILLFVFASCSKEEKINSSGKVVKVGVLVPLSGENKRYGYQSLLGLKAALSMQKYLKNGDKVVLEIIDTKSDLEVSLKALSKLRVKNVSVIFSLMGSPNMSKMVNKFKHYKIPTISTLASNDNIIIEDGFISQVCMDNKTQAIVSAHYIRDERLKQHVGIIYDSKNIYFSTLAIEFKKYFRTLGGKVDFFIDVSSISGLKEFEKVRSKEISMLFNATDAKTSLNIFKIIKKTDQKYEILGTDGLLSSALDVGKDDLEYYENIYVADHYAHNVNSTDNRKKLENKLDKYGFKESSYAFLSYDGYQLLMYSLNNCPQYSSACINFVMQDSDLIKGVSGNFSMIDAKVKREVYIDKIQNSILHKEVVIY